MLFSERLENLLDRQTPFTDQMHLALDCISDSDNDFDRGFIVFQCNLQLGVLFPSLGNLYSVVVVTNVDYLSGLSGSLVVLVRVG